MKLVGVLAETQFRRGGYARRSGGGLQRAKAGPQRGSINPRRALFRLHPVRRAAIKVRIMHYAIPEDRVLVESRCGAVAVG